MTTIVGPNQIEEGKGKATIILPGGTKINIPSAIYAPTTTRNLISFQDIRANKYQLRTEKQGETETLQILQDIEGKLHIKEVLPLIPPGLYAASIQSYHMAHQTPEITHIYMALQTRPPKNKHVQQNS